MMLRQTLSLGMQCIEQMLDFSINRPTTRNNPYTALNTVLIELGLSYIVLTMFLPHKAPTGQGAEGDKGGQVCLQLYHQVS